jgi:hypothetical protein
MINAVTVSPSLMVLVVKPLAERFQANVTTSAKKAGFDFAPAHAGINTMALLDRDLGEPLAVMKVNGFAEAVDRLTSVEIHFDPELCPIEWGAGSRLMAACARFSELMEGRLCNGLGNEIGEEAREAIAKHIDHIMTRRCAANREKQTVDLPTGENCQSFHSPTQSCVKPAVVRGHTVPSTSMPTQCLATPDMPKAWKWLVKW